jgi:uncharacterized protein YidB (DUF937 family)
LFLVANEETTMALNMSPITMGLLALLAYRTYQGKGRLAEMLGQGQPENAGARPLPSGTAVPGRPPGGNIFGGNAGGVPGAGGGLPSGGGLADILRGGLGGLLGGAAAGGLLSGGLGGLLKQFQDNGYGDTAGSWVGRGPNREITPNELEGALGRDTLQSLSQESGRPYNELLSELSESLPNDIDQLTPEGRLPTEEEARAWT